MGVNRPALIMYNYVILTWERQRHA